LLSRQRAPAIATLSDVLRASSCSVVKATGVSRRDGGGRRAGASTEPSPPWGTFFLDTSSHGYGVRNSGEGSAAPRIRRAVSGCSYRGAYASRLYLGGEPRRWVPHLVSKLQLPERHLSNASRYHRAITSAFTWRFYSCRSPRQQSEHSASSFLGTGYTCARAHA
jgi:hypothetical protein